MHKKKEKKAALPEKYLAGRAALYLFSLTRTRHSRRVSPHLLATARCPCNTFCTDVSLFRLCRFLLTFPEWHSELCLHHPLSGPHSPNRSVCLKRTRTLRCQGPCSHSEHRKKVGRADVAVINSYIFARLLGKPLLTVVDSIFQLFLKRSQEENYIHQPQQNEHDDWWNNGIQNPYSQAPREAMLW